MEVKPGSQKSRPVGDLLFCESSSWLCMEGRTLDLGELTYEQAARIAYRLGLAFWRLRDDGVHVARTGYPLALKLERER